MFNMQRASCNPVLQYCKNRELRRKVHDAYCNRGNQGNEWDSKEICARLVRLRLERAKLMGFKTPAAQILDTRMAKTPEAVYKLLDQIWKPVVGCWEQSEMLVVRWTRWSVTAGPSGSSIRWQWAIADIS